MVPGPGARAGEVGGVAGAFAADALTTNTVVLYDRPDTGRILHRIVQEMPDGTFITRGDANRKSQSSLPHPEESVSTVADILG